MWHAALFLHDPDDIAPGRYGDIVAVAGDPIADIGLLANVAVVIKGGTIAHDRRC